MGKENMGEERGLPAWNIPYRTRITISHSIYSIHENKEAWNATVWLAEEEEGLLEACEYGVDIWDVAREDSNRICK